MSEARLILGDALDVLRTLETASVDCVVTDPPYGQSNESYDKGVHPDVWRECFRVARPNAALVSFAGSPTYHRIASDIEAAGWQVRQMWAWVYRDGMMTCAWPKEGYDRLSPAMDPICFATKGKVLLDLERTGPEWPRTRNFNGYSERARTIREQTKSGRLPRQVVADPELAEWDFFAHPRGGRSASKDKTEHPNQKPVALMRWLIDKLPGVTILDPFAGSGSTLVACLQVGRNAIGIEIDPTYFRIAEKRIAEAEVNAQGGPLFAKVTEGSLFDVVA